MLLYKVLSGAHPENEYAIFCFFIGHLSQVGNTQAASQAIIKILLSTHTNLSIALIHI